PPRTQDHAGSAAPEIPTATPTPSRSPPPCARTPPAKPPVHPHAPRRARDAPASARDDPPAAPAPAPATARPGPLPPSHPSPEPARRDARETPAPRPRPTGRDAGGRGTRRTALPTRHTTPPCAGCNAAPAPPPVTGRVGSSALPLRHDRWATSCHPTGYAGVHKGQTLRTHGSSSPRTTLRQPPQVGIAHERQPPAVGRPRRHVDRPLPTV